MIVPIIIDNLGTVSKSFNSFITTLNMKENFYTLQKAFLLGTARILRKVLDT